MGKNKLKLSELENGKFYKPIQKRTVFSFMAGEWDTFRFYGFWGNGSKIMVESNVFGVKQFDTETAKDYLYEEV